MNVILSYTLKHFLMQLTSQSHNICIFHLWKTKVPQFLEKHGSPAQQGMQTPALNNVILHAANSPRTKVKFINNVHKLAPLRTFSVPVTISTHSRLFRSALDERRKSIGHLMFLPVNCCLALRTEKQGANKNQISANFQIQFYTTWAIKKYFWLCWTKLFDTTLNSTFSTIMTLFNSFNVHFSYCYANHFCIISNRKNLILFIIWLLVCLLLWNHLWWPNDPHS